MPSYKFQAWQADPLVKRTIVDDNKTPDDPADDLTYTGVALWRLVGRIDDADPTRFNTKLATTAPGYTVAIEGVDGFTVRYTSLEVATLKNALVVADRMNGEPLMLGTASIKNDAASWKPNWPLKLVSSDASIFGSRKPAGVQRISIEAGATQASPFDSGAAEQTLQPDGCRRPGHSTFGRLDADLAGQADRGDADRQVPDDGLLGRHQGGRHQPVAQVRLQGPVAP